MSFVAFGVVTKLYLWPWLQTRGRNEALLALVVPHLFRFVGLSFLVPEVVSPELPRAIAVPAAYGDLGAAILALIATLALARRASWAIAAVWPFNVLGGGRPVVRFLPRAFRRAARCPNAGRCVLHPDCDRAAAADHTCLCLSTACRERRSRAMRRATQDGVCRRRAGVSRIDGVSARVVAAWQHALGIGGGSQVRVRRGPVVLVKWPNDQRDNAGRPKPRG